VLSDRNFCPGRPSWHRGSHASYRRALDGGPRHRRGRIVDACLGLASAGLWPGDSRDRRLPRSPALV